MNKKNSTDMLKRIYKDIPITTNQPIDNIVFLHELAEVTNHQRRSFTKIIQNPLVEQVKSDLAFNTISDNTKREVLSNRENVSLLIQNLKEGELIRFVSLLGNSEEANKIKEILFLDFSNLKSLILRSGLFAECINVLNSSNEFDRKIKKTLFLDAKYENLIMESMYIDNIKSFLKNLNAEDELDAQIKEKYFLDDIRVSQIIDRIDASYITGIHRILSTKKELDQKIKRKFFIEKKLYEAYKKYYDDSMRSNRIPIFNKYNYFSSDTYQNNYSLFSLIVDLDASDEIDNEIEKSIFFDDKIFEFLIEKTDINLLSSIIHRIVSSPTKTEIEIKREIFLNKRKYHLILKRFLETSKTAEIREFIMQDIRNMCNSNNIEIKKSIFLDEENFEYLATLIQKYNSSSWLKIGLASLICDVMRNNQDDREIIKGLSQEKYLSKIVKQSTIVGIIRLIKYINEMNIIDDNNRNISMSILDNVEVKSKIQQLGEGADEFAYLLYYLGNNLTLTNKIDYQILTTILKSRNLPKKHEEISIEQIYYLYMILSKFLKESIQNCDAIGDDGQLTDTIQDTVENIFLSEKEYEEEQIREGKLESPVGNYQLLSFNRGTYMVNKEGDYVFANIDTEKIEVNRNNQTSEFIVPTLSHHRHCFYQSLIALDISEDKIPTDEDEFYYGKQGTKYGYLSFLIEGEGVHIFCPTKNSLEQNKFLQEKLDEMYEIENNEAINPRGLKFRFELYFSRNNQIIAAIGKRPIFIEDIHRIMVKQSVIEEQDIKSFEPNSKVHKK